jgi:hypothetical protein
MGTTPGRSNLPSRPSRAGRLDFFQAVSLRADRAAPNGGIIVTAGADAQRHRDLIITLAARHKLPVTVPEELLARRHVPETATAIADQRLQFTERMNTLRYELGIFTAKLQQASREIDGRKARLAAYNAQLQLDQARQRQHEAVLQQLAEVRARISDIKERLAIANNVLKRVEVRAPRKGIVQAIKVHAVGAVVKPGETIAEVVPVGDSLILVAEAAHLFRVMGITVYRIAGFGRRRCDS